MVKLACFAPPKSKYLLLSIGLGSIDPSQEVDLPSRYCFDLEDGLDVIRDETGVVADSVEQAVEEATVIIEEMRSSDELPPSHEGWVMVIRDEDGTELKRIPL